ncbi:hypothetical protein [Trinickia dinghuensis]|uniref:hypothetical protein n=1 Tax=Trinickia dinghuensis TaxID=2291023 RepID=UPI0011C047DA|nr:hypothetical protein [Trinickia dinghuensis]
MSDQTQKATDAMPPDPDLVFVEDFGPFKIYRRPDGKYEIWEGDQRVGDSFPTLEAAELAADAEILAREAKGPVNPSNSTEKPKDSGPTR